MVPPVRRRRIACLPARFIGAVALAGLFALLPTTAWAHPLLDKARATYERGEVAATLLLLTRAERDATLRTDDLVELYLLRGTCLIALGKTADADDAFDRILELRPLYQPDPVLASPDVRAAFQRRSEVHHQAEGVELGEPRITAPDIAVPIMRNADKVAHVVVLARAMGDPAFTPFELRIEAGEATGRLPDVEMWRRASGAQLQFVVEAKDARGVLVARLGDALAPLAFSVAVGDAKRVAAQVKKTATSTPVERRTPLAPKILTGVSVAALVGAGITVVGALVLAAVSAGSYAVLRSLPQRVGTQTTPLWMGLAAGYVGGMAGALLALVATLLLVPAGVGALVVALVLRQLATSQSGEKPG